MPPVFRTLLPLALAGAGCHHGGPAANPEAAGSANRVIGYTWILHGIEGQPAGIGSAGRQVTLRFEANGSANGFGGCNRYRATYTIAADSLHFQPVTSTRMACSEGSSLEQRYFLALTQVRAWRLTDRHLELLAADGTTIADFDRP
jgi:heat shock protein HslJ